MPGHALRHEQSDWAQRGNGQTFGNDVRAHTMRDLPAAGELLAFLAGFVLPVGLYHLLRAHGVDPAIALLAAPTRHTCPRRPVAPLVRHLVFIVATLVLTQLAINPDAVAAS